LTEPSTNSDDAYTYEAYLDPAPQVSAYVEHLADNTNTPRSLTLYSARETVDEWTSVGRTTHQFIWGGTEKESHTEILAFPPLVGDTDIYVDVVIADNDNSVRPVIIEAVAGGVTASTIETIPTHGRALNIVRLTLPQVPAETRHVEISIHSPTDNGDSAILAGVNATYQCISEGAQMRITPPEHTMGVGTEHTFNVRVTPGLEPVNGVAIYGSVDPNHLEIIDATPTTLLGNEILSFTHTISGDFRYVAGEINAGLTAPFDALMVTVKAISPTNNTAISLSSSLGVSDVSGNNGSILEEAEGAVVVITNDQFTGAVDMQGRPDRPASAWSIPITVTLSPPSIITPTHAFTATTDQNGLFTIDLTGVAPGTYDARVKGHHTLRNVATNVTLIDGDNRYFLGELREGDVEIVKTFNHVNMDDSEILVETFDSCIGDDTFVPNADLDESGCIRLPDFGLLASNFELMGDLLVTATTTLPTDAGLRPASVSNQHQADARLLFEPIERQVAAGETTTILLTVVPGNASVNGAMVEMAFNPTLLEIEQVELSDQLPFVLRPVNIDQEVGLLRFAVGVLGETLNEKFTLATLRVKLKQDTIGTQLTLNNPFSITDLSGPTGSVLGDVSQLRLYSTDGQKLFLPIIQKP
ncbi:MAG: hypothetical protein AAF629_21330, partial [Chloroflexota bacterium]